VSGHVTVRRAEPAEADLDAGHYFDEA